MRLWYDWEFVEWGAGRPLVPLSLGMVREDGKEFYRQFLCGLDDALAHAWVSVHVVPQLEEFVLGVPSGKLPWVAYPEMIQEDILEFCGDKPELWGYFADYDHVLFSQIFGRMINLPSNFPKYTLDIIQEVKMRQVRDGQIIKLPPQGKGEHHALLDARWNKVAWEFLFPGGLPSLRGI